MVAQLQLSATMNGHTSYADRLELFRKNDAERDALVTEVVRDFEELKLKYAEKCDDYSVSLSCILHR